MPGKNMAFRWSNQAATIKYKGIEYDFGEGGIHASWENKIFESDDNYVIKDIDVTSFYPNLAIVNNFSPEHLGGAFSKIYKNIFEQRQMELHLLARANLFTSISCFFCVSIKL